MQTDHHAADIARYRWLRFCERCSSAAFIWTLVAGLIYMPLWMLGGVVAIGLVVPVSIRFYLSSAPQSSEGAAP